MQWQRPKPRWFLHGVSTLARPWADKDGKKATNQWPQYIDGSGLE
jgi:hypothetical protein